MKGRTKQQMAQEMVDGLLKPEDTSHFVIALAMELCKTAGLTDLYNELAAVHEQKYQDYLEYHRRKSREYQLAHPRRAHRGSNDPPILKHRGPAKPKGPKEYTERQLGIIKGTVPYEETHGQEYHAIRRIAVSRGDIDIISFCDTMIVEKREDYVERNRRMTAARYHRGKNDPESPYYRPPQVPKLTPWERSVLFGYTDIDKCPTERLEHILDICRQNNDEENERTAEFWLTYKEDSLSVCRAQTRDDAIALIESMTWMPIVRPETWNPR